MAPPNNDEAGENHAGTRVAFPLGALVAPVSRYAPGVVLSGKYRLEALLGEGGMGAVWSASNLLLDLPVAIKLIRADLDRSALRARLQLEARSAAKLGHPAIVRVYDVGESELGDPYIVMELLRGETLSKVLAQGRLSAARAVQLLLPIIDALASAHARGIVHRDLKPDNLMIALEQQRIQPKILDFGIAKLTDPRDTDHKLTEVGMVVGSPEYMSPEQARGRDDVDASADVWAMCVVLYESITGTTPFAAPNYNALLRAIVEDDPRSLMDHAAGDLALWEILKRGLAKDRRNRYASISELGRVLAGWLITHGVFEDACGTSVEAKWLGAQSDALPISAGSGSTRALSADFQPKITRDSNPQATGPDSRGPFTATIRSHGNGRTRTVQIALGACALLGALGLGFARGHSYRPAPTQVAAARAVPTTRAVPAAAVVPSATPIVVSASPALPIPIAASTSVDDDHSSLKVGSQSAHANKSTALPAHAAPSAAALVRPSVVANSSASAPVVTNTADPTKQAPKRALDLLAPY
jgi:serine/threonine protein kinase